MASDKSEFEGLLAVIDAKIAALQRVKESILAAASLGALGATGGDLDPVTLTATGTVGAAPEQAGASRPPVDLPTGVFRGKGLADAIRLYLSIAKRKQTNKEIASALQDGGLATTAPESFDNTLSATLYRLKNAGELLKFKDGWDLAESYPASFRQRLEEAKESSPKRKKKPKKKPAAVTPKAGKAAKPTPAQEPILRAV